MEEDDVGPIETVKNFFGHFPPVPLAALMFAIPFVAVDAFNYYSVGAALVVSLPILAILYSACGAVACYVGRVRGGTTSSFLATGALAGLCLWAFSTIFNTILSLMVGASTLGMTLLLGLPYLCLCAPLQLFGSLLMGGLGGLGYGLFAGQHSTENEDTL